MIIFLDIDGVLVTTPSWKAVENMSDGFMKFNEAAVKNLQLLCSGLDVEIILTTSHKDSYTLSEWVEVFKNRGLPFNKISIIASDSKSRCGGITDRVITLDDKAKYLIIDDDSSLHDLPHEIKQNWIQTKFLLGFNDASLNEALSILHDSS